MRKLGSVHQHASQIIREIGMTRTLRTLTLTALVLLISLGPVIQSVSSEGSRIGDTPVCPGSTDLVSGETAAYGAFHRSEAPFREPASAAPLTSPCAQRNQNQSAAVGIPKTSPTGSIDDSPSDLLDGAQDDFLDGLARDTWTYLSSDEATANHMPYSWWSASIEGGAYANPAEIGLYALAWLAAFDLGRPWSPSWAEASAEVSAILDQLRVWQTGSQSHQPHGPNAYDQSVFYQWYWISRDPPVVGDDVELNQLVPSVDNAWLAASLMTIREYARAHRHTSLAQPVPSAVEEKAEAILDDIDFSLWYHPDSHQFSWGAVQDPSGGTLADLYSNENRIINFVARALGHLDAEAFRASLDALGGPTGAYTNSKTIPVEKMAWDGSYFTYAAPALFIKEIGTAYGAGTIVPATQAQIAYAHDQGYVKWGLSDCFDVGDGGYVQQGAPPVVSPDPPETRPGLVTPHASSLALITPLAPEAITNLETFSATFTCVYSAPFGLRDSVMANPDAPDYGQCSDRFSALAQLWIFLSVVNHENGFIWRYFYRNPGVLTAHIEMYGGARICLPVVVRSNPGIELMPGFSPNVVTEAESVLSPRDSSSVCDSERQAAPGAFPGRTGGQVTDCNQWGPGYPRPMRLDLSYER